MYTEEDLDAAIAAGALSEASVASFRAYVAQRRQTAPADEESIRLVTSFSDVFVVLASLLAIGALA
jgi:hypothetical protein